MPDVTKKASKRCWKLVLPLRRTKDISHIGSLRREKQIRGSHLVCYPVIVLGGVIGALIRCRSKTGGLVGITGIVTNPWAPEGLLFGAPDGICNFEDVRLDFQWIGVD